MLICMRTTLNLPDALVEQAKATASRDGRTLTSLVEEGLRAVLQARAAPRAVSLPAYGSGAGAMLVDLDDRDALAAALEDP